MKEMMVKKFQNDWGKFSHLFEDTSLAVTWAKGKEQN
jgi:hypothetical protein